MFEFKVKNSTHAYGNWIIHYFISGLVVYIELQRSICLFLKKELHYIELFEGMINSASNNSPIFFLNSNNSASPILYGVCTDGTAPDTNLI